LHSPLDFDLAVILSAAKDPENSNSPLLIDPFQPRRQPLVLERPEASENKLQKVGKFPALKRSAFSHHVSPRIHHNLTIKKPGSAHHFSQNPCKNTLHHANIFFSHYHKKIPWPTLKTPS
jgi:hypothetical protein